MNVISTFAGCGGSSTGYKAAGCQMLAMVEWDRHAVDCYALNHPTTTTFHADIHKVTGADLLKATGLAVGELDLLDGSPPCQGFSTAGRRVLDDPRNSLFRQQMRLIREMRPRHVVIENVAGMVRGKMRRVAGEIFKALQAEGYTVVAGLIKATAFGVPQYRPRVFFLGSQVGTPTLPVPTHRQAVTARAGLVGVEPGLSREMNGTRAQWLIAHLQPGESGADVMKRHGLKGSYFNTVMVHPQRPAFTLTKVPPYGGYWHWTRRHIAINEALLLTGFPADYKLIGPFAKQWKRIGNSVAPPVSTAIARALLAGEA